GHQAYPHKVLTGRRDQLPTIRKYEGLAPFCSINESEHDIMGAGHASTSVSYAVGLKEAMLRGHGEDGRVVAVIGDGALTGGVAFEALHNAGGMDLPIVIVVNDNGMSIAPNVGALSRYFNRIRMNPRLHKAREDVETTLTKLPVGIGERIERLGPIVKESLKAYWAPGLFFEELDLAYVGVIDGHDVKALREAIGEALEADRPVVVHCKTIKGKGFAPAEDGGLEGMEKWHAAKPASIVNGAPAAAKKAVGSAKAAPPQYTKVFGDALVREARRDDRVVGITAAMNTGTGLDILQRELPERYYDVGIAEQHAVLFAAGLALQGAKPVAAIYSTFLQRGFDQIVHDVCLQNLDVTFALDRAGLVGADGATHQGLYDIAFLRCLPNITLMAPKDENELRHMLRTAVEHPGPVALRYPRGNGLGVALDAEIRALPIGRGELLRDGDDLAIVALGSRVAPALEAAERLAAEGISVAVFNARFVKPLDVVAIADLARRCGALLTVEEHALAGGFGSAVLEALAGEGVSVPVRVLAVPDVLVEHGDPAAQLVAFGLDAGGIAAAGRRLVGSLTGRGAPPNLRAAGV
ncbi:MAG: 1-deoxy-D-xylulose-5-phosphate synthase, partial [Immundisolibacter sp.]|uniref:1-deoxy-D-xylulose-5-phosphate synthase n=1 Tax=Immundisolibacter sp. TaxID=1934948 RepID=UPI003EDFDE10